MKTENKFTYFPGLNSLRFIAAFLVIIHHIEQFKSIFGLKNFSGSPFIQAAGGLGVSFFFVLSGFLVTYFFLAEKNKFGDISIKKFYARRVLRIWPLYLLIVILSLFVFPKINFLYVPGHTEELSNHFGVKALLFFVMLPNVVTVLFPFVPYCSQSWAIGVEEQFYLFWPWLVKFSKNYLRIFLFAIALFLLTLKLLNYITLHRQQFIHNKSIFNALDFLRLYLSLLRVNCMIVGGIGAFIIFFKKEKILKVIYRRDFQILILLITVLFFYKGIYVKGIHHEFFSVLFIILILNVSTNPNSLIQLENKFLNLLGQISYGLYMYHILSIVTALFIIKKIFHGNFNLLANLFLYLFSICLTIVLSILSYYLFEQRFLKLKLFFVRR